jgi:cell division transport system ATP-binding protein
MIEFKNVSISRAGKEILRDFEARLLKGSLTVIYGGSGSGKTTLCDLMLGKLQPQTGEITINSEKPSRSFVGAISPDLELLDDRSLAENVALPLEIAGRVHSRLEQTVTAALERVGIEQDSNKVPSAVSGSVRQKAAVARAVVSEPYVLIADEPTLHLDLAASKEIAELLMKEQLRGMTVVVITSDAAFRDSFPNATHIAL